MPRMLRLGLLLTSAALLACSTTAPEMNSDTAPQTSPGTTGADPSTASATPPTSDGSDTTFATPESESASATVTDTDDPVGGTTSAPTTGDAGATDFGMPGPFPPGNTRFTVQNGERELLVELWYPADPSAAEAAALGHPIAEFVPEGPDRDTMLGLLADLSPAGEIGTRLNTSSAFDAPPAAAGPYPLVVLSHCHECVRFAYFTVAERLASHGFLVAAPDHPENNLFDPGASLDDEFLVTRVSDMQAVLDAVLDPNSAEVPAPQRGLADPARVGALGHSYGAATAGRLAQDDPRILAALPIAAPVENPLFPGTHVADIDVPMLLVLAVEDNSIGAFGNMLLESNFQAANPPVRLVSVADAGHWGFTDICGLTAAVAAGCGDGTRQTSDEPFTYLDIAIGREIAGAYSLAFFDRYLRGNLDADAFLDAATPSDVVTVQTRL
jgi:dienelactone hydrolase